MLEARIISFNLEEYINPVQLINPTTIYAPSTITQASTVPLINNPLIPTSNGPFISRKAATIQLMNHSPMTDSVRPTSKVTDAYQLLNNITHLFQMFALY